MPFFARRLQRSLFDTFRQRLAFDQFHDEIVRAAVEQRADVGMIQRRNRSRFTLETLAKLSADVLMVSKSGAIIRDASPDGYFQKIDLAVALLS